MNPAPRSMSTHPFAASASTLLGSRRGARSRTASAGFRYSAVDPRLIEPSPGNTDPSNRDRATPRRAVPLAVGNSGRMPDKRFYPLLADCELLPGGSVIDLAVDREDLDAAHHFAGGWRLA